mmetsp:Transcript_143325/g.445529  ORF Transcript_143325/g.445529 Transcript_143325/m.445529 type:complete len:261 (-) Transcript_143325:310-1092(-)
MLRRAHPQALHDGVEAQREEDEEGPGLHGCARAHRAHVAGGDRLRAARGHLLLRAGVRRRGRGGAAVGVAVGVAVGLAVAVAGAEFVARGVEEGRGQPVRPALPQVLRAAGRVRVAVDPATAGVAMAAVPRRQRCRLGRRRLRCLARRRRAAALPAHVLPAGAGRQRGGGSAASPAPAPRLDRIARGLGGARGGEWRFRLHVRAGAEGDGMRGPGLAAVRGHELEAGPQREARPVGRAGRLCVGLLALRHAAAHGLAEHH